MQYKFILLLKIFRYLAFWSQNRFMQAIVIDAYAYYMPFTCYYLLIIFKWFCFSYWVVLFHWGELPVLSIVEFNFLAILLITLIAKLILTGGVNCKVLFAYANNFCNKSINMSNIESLCGFLYLEVFLNAFSEKYSLPLDNMTLYYVVMLQLNVISNLVIASDCTLLLGK